ncbi:RidA family protein [Nocardioides sp. CN2-186]|uniref:RidA family protein n=1 Tax=Nocardioides tweenelious TaxID=3156607 RepID=UPI0032B5E54F
MATGVAQQSSWRLRLRHGVSDSARIRTNARQPAGSLPYERTNRPSIIDVTHGVSLELRLLGSRTSARSACGGILVESTPPASVQVRYAQARYARTVSLQGFVSVSGVLPYDSLGDVAPIAFEEQARRAFRNLAAVLSVFGASLRSTVTVTLLLKNLSDYQQFTAIQSEFLSGPLPAVTRIGVSELADGAVIEIHALAATGLPASF